MALTIAVPFALSDGAAGAGAARSAITEIDAAAGIGSLRRASRALPAARLLPGTGAGAARYRSRLFRGSRRLDGSCRCFGRPCRLNAAAGRGLGGRRRLFVRLWLRQRPVAGARPWPRIVPMRPLPPAGRARRRSERLSRRPPGRLRGLLGSHRPAQPRRLERLVRRIATELPQCASPACRVPRYAAPAVACRVGRERAWHGGIGLAGTRSRRVLRVPARWPPVCRDSVMIAEIVCSALICMGRHRSVRRPAARTARPLRRPSHRHHRRARPDARRPGRSSVRRPRRRTVERGCRRAGLPLRPMPRTAIDAELCARAGIDASRLGLRHRQRFAERRRVPVRCGRCGGCRDCRTRHLTRPVLPIAVIARCPSAICRSLRASCAYRRPSGRSGRRRRRLRRCGRAEPLPRPGFSGHSAAIAPAAALGAAPRSGFGEAGGASAAGAAP